MINKSEYRREYEELLKRSDEQQNVASRILDPSTSVAEKKTVVSGAASVRATSEVDRLLSVVRDRKETGVTRAMALQKLDIEVSNREDIINEVLAILGDKKEPVELRRTALTVLQQASFSSAIFITKRPDYFNVLRSIIDDKDKQLRFDALETLAAHKDEYAQRRLLDGLKAPAKALVAPEKAIQLLGYDVHAELFTTLRDIAENSSHLESKVEAVRILGADPESKELLQKMFRNKSENKEVRATCAVAVQAIDPEDFSTSAKQTVMDEAEDSDIRAICLNALALDGEIADRRKNAPNERSAMVSAVDTSFDAYVQQLQEKAASKELGKAATQYLRNMDLKKNVDKN
ncbi:hypothetical protein ACMA1I_14175 [Pontibacter sp. 13R65]|uniref:hypothetical protein n=1 Tax=Pontibacter sp. 13R65 TaxID=3127458 RepID=UPI00301C2071